MSMTTTANLGNGSAGAPSADIQYAAKRRPPNSARFVQGSIDCLVRQSNDSATGSAPSQDQRSNDPSARGLPNEQSRRPSSFSSAPTWPRSTSCCATSQASSTSRRTSCLAFCLYQCSRRPSSRISTLNGLSPATLPVTHNRLVVHPTLFSFSSRSCASFFTPPQTLEQQTPSASSVQARPTFAFKFSVKFQVLDQNSRAPRHAFGCNSSPSYAEVHGSS